MAAFEYRCPRCGDFESRFDVGTAPPTQSCPSCGDPAPRLFSAPAILSAPSALTHAMDADQRSAHEPAVVSAPPPHAARVRTSQNPLHARLSRP